MRSFESWFENHYVPDEDVYMPMHCYGCGKDQIVNLAALENGDTGWYAPDPASGVGLCGGTVYCTP